MFGKEDLCSRSRDGEGQLSGITRHCEEHSDAAISRYCSMTWIVRCLSSRDCFAALAMTGQRQLRVENGLLHRTIE